MSLEIQRGTFYLLGCESCGKFTDPPKKFDIPYFARPTSEPMRCECGDLLLLAECFIAPQTAMWQTQRGAPWHHVIYPEALPDKPGRQVWMNG